MDLPKPTGLPPGELTPRTLVETARAHGVHVCFLIGRLQNQGRLDWKDYRRQIPKVRPFVDLAEATAMTAQTTPRPTTLGGTFSFYVPHTDTVTLAVVGSLADAVTVKGPKGPAAIRDLRLSGWDTPVIFDRSGYNPKIAPVDSERWFDEQAAAGADRPLTAGTWVAWSEDRHTLERAIEIEAARCDGHSEATALLALDYRWLTKAPMDLTDALNAIGRPAALVLAHPTDPLGPGHAVEGLITVTRNVANLSILRTDHGGFGALVYGASATLPSVCAEPTGISCPPSPAVGARPTTVQLGCSSVTSWTGSPRRRSPGGPRIE